MASATHSPRWSSSRDVAGPKLQNNEIPGDRARARRARGRRAADDPDDRLRQALEHAGRPAPARTRRCCCGSTPRKDLISLFSLPRDLGSTSPGYGTGKLNEAYSLGGAKKTLKTVKNLTGLEINHVVEDRLPGLRRRRRRDRLRLRRRRPRLLQRRLDGSRTTPRSTSTPATSGSAADALDYVRYRHTDTDIVRAARQQDFLREARAQVPVGELARRSSAAATQRADRHLHRVHRVGHRHSAQDLLGMLKSFLIVRTCRSTRSTSRATSATRPTRRDRHRRTDRDGGRRVPRRRGLERGPARRRERARASRSDEKEAKKDKARSRRPRSRGARPPGPT